MNYNVRTGLKMTSGKPTEENSESENHDIISIIKNASTADEATKAIKIT